MNREMTKLLRKRCVSIQFLLSENSPLRGEFEGGNEISLLTDGSIFPHVAQHEEWSFNETRFIGQACPTGPYHLIDIGANVGLFSRQVLINYPQVISASCFEPSRDNTEHLKRNLKAMPMVSVFDFGLGQSDGELAFYKDSVNGGNFSFNRDAVAGRAHQVIVAKIRRITEGLLDKCMGDEASDRRLIWKSDTQGLDEALMSELPESFWQRVDLACFEGWRIDKPSHDEQAFRNVLNSFEYVYIIGSRNKRLRRIGSARCISYLSGRDRKWADFYLSRVELH
ncbi:FkbM family methyltransferase [Ruegeria sp. AU67]|uniref:FkbM family methyltransferase n=1 Tax=Ruegeria sp. AU67 TaxID=2108530 RepID=UPI000D69193C|nr:FkbM family methyltransferase [Ruegeria sp. AU67]